MWYRTQKGLWEPHFENVLEKLRRSFGILKNLAKTSSSFVIHDKTLYPKAFSIHYLFSVLSILITNLLFWGFLPFENNFLCSKFIYESNYRNRAPWTNKTSSVYLKRIEVIKFSNFTLTTSFFWYDFSALHLSINFIHFTRQWCSNSVSFFWRYSSRISKFLTFLWKLSLQVLKEFDNWRKKYQFNVNYLFEYDFMRLEKLLLVYFPQLQL